MGVQTDWQPGEACEVIDEGLARAAKIARTTKVCVFVDYGGERFRFARRSAVFARGRSLFTSFHLADAQAKVKS